MKWLARLLGIAVLALLVWIFVTSPELLDKVWLWAIGFAGHFVLLIQKGYELMVRSFQDRNNEDKAKALPQLWTHGKKDLKTSIEQIEARLLKVESQIKHEERSSSHH